MNGEIQFDSGLKNHISKELAWHYRIIPKEVNAAKMILFIALSKIEDQSSIQAELQALLGKQIELHALEEDQITRGLSLFYRNADGSTYKKSFSLQADFIEELIEDAKKINSSDIHIEKYENKARIRFRVDGVLITRYTVAINQYNELINKIKIRANLDISEKRLPQDGRIQLPLVDLRVSILPTLFGEKVVMRLLSKESKTIDLKALGMNAKEYSVFTKTLKKSNGIILISGPTGSGKTTTLYGALQLLNEEGRNILTIEDPVEYTLEGINQVNLNEGIGLTFSKALKSFLRQDPDVIMLGEIRDADTAEMSARASLTGHLVLSTIHTNSAWGSLSRLQDMGIPGYLLASTVNLSIAQRLVRILCSDCKTIEPYHGNGWPRGLKQDFPEQLAFPVGCDHCHYTGYSGRKAIYEMIPIDEQIKQRIVKNLSMEPSYLNSKGLQTMQQNALSLLENKLTSLEEVINFLI